MGFQLILPQKLFLKDAILLTCHRFRFDRVHYETGTIVTLSANITRSLSNFIDH